MADDFDDVRFPEEISFGSSGGPMFSTDVVRMSSGFEQRNVNWSYPLERWNVAWGVKSPEDLALLVAFFYARQGRARGFRFKNQDDYFATLSEIGIGDSVEVLFQLVKNYTSGPRTFARKISRPVATTVDIFVDAVLQTENVDYTVDYDTGIVLFASASIPPNNDVITASFEFDIPMRFDTDELPANLVTYEARAANVTLVEMRVP